MATASGFADAISRARSACCRHSGSPRPSALAAPRHDKHGRWRLGESHAYRNVFLTGDVPGESGAARFRTASSDTVVRSLGSGEATIAEVVHEALGFAGLRGTPDLA